MESKWEAGQPPTDGDAIAECVYCTRLIGSDSALVLHGGGNSSVKAPVVDITGARVDALHVKGSGWDMATIERPGLVALRQARVRELLELESLSDADMMRELAAARFDPGAPNPSVETLLHAFLPFTAVQHSHADVIVTLTNLADGASVVEDVFGSDVVVIPYVMPGFDLAREVRSVWPGAAHDGTVGMVLLNHGLFTFGETARQAYERHVDLITRAEKWLAREAPVDTSPAPPAVPAVVERLAELRGLLSAVAGRPMVVRRHVDADVRRFVQRSDLRNLASRGPLTPDHVIRTKRVPLVGTDVGAYAEDYRQYVEAHRHRAEGQLTELDPAPRIVLDPALGMLAAGPTAWDADVAADIYHHTIPVLVRAEDHLGGYVALPPHELFDVEYWELEQAKLARPTSPPELTGTVALVTGAASGIGRACAAELMSRGACVTGLDVDRAVLEAFDSAGWHGVAGDVTDHQVQARAVTEAVERFGGIDIAVLSAGVFGPSRRLAELEIDDWRRTMAVNVDAAADLLALLHPVLALSPVLGRVAVISSKNVPAPGRGAAAYSSSKAALTQLCRVAALEWADDGIRVNLVHPDAVFDTGLWTDELLRERAEGYGVTVDEYRRRNLLGVEVTSAGVARLVAELCGETFAMTTGAQVPIDGGNERVI